MDELNSLVFSFYRDDPEVQSLLEPIHSSVMHRCWSTVVIECMDPQHLSVIEGLLKYLSVPFASLGLCNQIVLWLPGQSQSTYSIQLKLGNDHLV